MSSIRVTTNFRDNFGTDLGTKLVTKDYLMSVYPGIAQELGKAPELWVWGSNSGSQLGINGPGIRSTPVTTFAGGTDWKQVSGGGNNTAAIKTDGTLWVWGSNSDSQLGINAPSGNRSTPVTTFAGGTNWKQISCGASAVAAIKTDGTLWVWGSNITLKLGINANSTDIRSTPVTTFAGGTNWKQVDFGGDQAVAIKTDGTLWVWGIGTDGQLGNNQIFNRSTPVTTFAGGTDWKQVSGGGNHTAAIKTDGTLWTWGRSGYGQLGNTLLFNYILTPVTTFAGGTNWKQVACGYRFTTAIKTDGTLWTWGSGNYGRLGNAVTTGIISTPVTTFAGGTNWKQVSTGTANTSAIKTDGTLWIWGRNNNAQLGINDATDRFTPVTTFAGGTNWKQVSGEGNNTAAIESADFI